MLERLKQWWSFDAATYEAPAGVPSPDEHRELVLYKSNRCGYCLRVTRVIAQCDLDLEIHDTGGNPEARQELFDLSGPTLDFVSLAKGMGVPGIRVDDAASLVQALEASYATPGPQLIEAWL